MDPKKKKLLGDHKQVGKKFYPPAARIGLTEIHYVDHILPEIAWIGYFIERFGILRGVDLAISFIETAWITPGLQDNRELTLVSFFRRITADQWQEFGKRLKAKDTFLECLDVLAPFVRCYPKDNPFRGLFEQPPTN